MLGCENKDGKGRSDPACSSVSGYSQILYQWSSEEEGVVRIQNVITGASGGDRTRSPEGPQVLA